MIVRMKHLDLVCTAADRERTLAQLRDLGAVHLDLGSAGGAAVVSARGEIDEAEKAVRLILKAREARGTDGTHGTGRTVSDVLADDVERSALQSEKERLEREIKIYAPYGDFDPELAKKLAERGVCLRLNKDGTFSISGEDAASPLRSGKDSASPLGGDASPLRYPEMRLGAMQTKLAQTDGRIADLTARIAASDETAILAQYPALKEKLAFEQAKELMETKGAIAVISGWIPVSRVTSLSSAVRTGGWGVLLRDPTEGETPPTLIDPPKFVKPVKALFEGLGIAPAYDEADVSVPFMCYFSLFFAMLVGDGGYGLIILGLTLFGWRRFRKSGAEGPKATMTRSWLVLMTVFSLATVAWGVISNTWFGAGFPWCAEWPTVRWLADPSYKNMMFLCFTIGVSHLMLARLWNGVCKINDRSCLSEFGWAGILFFMYWITNVIVGIFTDGIPIWLFGLFGVSFVTVFIQAKGIEKGLLFLTVMSTLGDIISYVRLFAVGLASVKVAENFNGMALSIFGCTDTIWMKPLLAIGMVFVLLVGHGLNFAMAGLSILVHAVRLNTLEFSNHKGVSWAGYAFRPFKSAKE